MEGKNAIEEETGKLGKLLGVKENAEYTWQQIVQR